MISKKILGVSEETQVVPLQKKVWVLHYAAIYNASLADTSKLDDELFHC